MCNSNDCFLDLPIFSQTIFHISRNAKKPEEHENQEEHQEEHQEEQEPRW
jgi:hypothetical protein